MSAAKGKAPTALTVEALDETQSTNKGNHVNNFNASTPSLTKAKPLTTVTTTGATALIESSNLPEIEHHGQRVITLASMDAVHQRAEGTARRNFNANKDKLVEGEDFYRITQPDEIRSLGLSRENGSTAASITLLTESGYLLLVKSFTDNLKHIKELKNDIPNHHRNQTCFNYS